MEKPIEFKLNQENMLTKKAILLFIVRLIITILSKEKIKFVMPSKFGFRAT